MPTYIRLTDHRDSESKKQGVLRVKILLESK